MDNKNEIMITKKGKKKKYYYCSSYIKDKKCSKHSISKQLLEEFVSVLTKFKEKLEKEEKLLNNKLETISNLFEGNEIRSIWDSDKEEYFLVW